MSNHSTTGLGNASIDQGFHQQSNRLQHWTPVINAWFRILTSYCRAAPLDSPYWHNERTQVGLFAASAWKSGHIALEEFSQKKRSEAGRSTGRTDLWLKCGDREDFFEAKAFTSPNTLSETFAWARNSLTLACQDARKTLRDRSTTDCVGLLFIRVRLRKGLARPAEDIKSLRSELSRIRHDAMFWHFHNSRRMWPEEGRSIFPGILAIAKGVGRMR